jgi:6,7-dimethyl-8-ribityllumazine synthase
MKVLEGHQDAKNLRFGIVVSKYNEFVTERLLAGACEVLNKAGANEKALEIARVPGAFEIPLVARRLARSGRFDAVIGLGAIIRGETPHFEYISREASRGIAQAAWESDIPVVFGVLTTESVEQALDRAGSIERNKGAEAARTAIEMATLMKALGEPAPPKRSLAAGRRRATRTR